MAPLDVLGPAAIDHDELRRLVAAQLDRPVDDLQLSEVRAAVVPYDLDALTTAGRYRVHGEVLVAGDPATWAFFVKVVQSWQRSPTFAMVPEHLREAALAMLPWQVEPAVYRTDLRDRLPSGLTMPVAHAVHVLDDCSAALWLEDVRFDPSPWPSERLSAAAGLLGRLAGSAAVAELRWTGRPLGQRGIRGYAEGRVRHQVVPALRDDELWQHPLVQQTFHRGLRQRLLRWAERLGEVVDVLERVPQLTLHGDACTRNLLPRCDAGDLVLIDYGFWGSGPVGFDLGQLLLGEVQMGERSAEELPALEAACVPAYRAGLELEGAGVDEGLLRHAHALQMVLFSALSSPPVEHLGAPLTPELVTAVRQRAHAAEWVLDLADATA